MNPVVCVLCGASGDASLALLQWHDGQYGYGPRCNDHEACRRRVIANGDQWPLAEKLPQREVAAR
jgi:hypothetical protein